VLTSLLIYQGLTISEVQRLKLYHIDIDAGIINVPRSRKLSKRSLEMHRSQQLLFYKYINEVRPKQEIESQDGFLLNKFGKPVTSQSVNSFVKTFKYLFPANSLIQLILERV
jgi:site-specific recombinase XerD